MKELLFSLLVGGIVLELKARGSRQHSRLWILLPQDTTSFTGFQDRSRKENGIK